MQTLPMPTVIEGKGISKSDKELVQSILGGEMRNAWEPTAPGEARDTRGLTSKAKLSRIVSPRFRSNYDNIFRKR